ncbi:hypothetical protein WISP_09398 [Willisornis vidua]|uniref:Uncharacterized protein n=1 Tax=Willisornis vidua TaxID=1566151 RepID=A0ABQ9DT23_9PASS|nr:hypothetical protein WISP_09398 [Willisornis vidua]
MAPIFQWFYIGCIGEKLRGTELANSMELTPCTKKFYKGKNKLKELQLKADLILKLEEAENISIKVQIYEDCQGKNFNFDLDRGRKETPNISVPKSLAELGQEHRKDMELLQSPEEAPGWSEDGAALLEGKAVRAGIVQPGEEKLWGDPTVSLQCLKGTCKIDGERPLTRPWRNRTKENGFPLAEGRVRWNIGKKLFPVRVGRPWHRLGREAVAAPSLKCPRPGWTGLGATWAGGRCPCPGQRVEWDDLYGPFRPRPFYDSVK